MSDLSFGFQGFPGRMGHDPFLNSEAPLRLGDKDSLGSRRVSKLQRDLKSAGYYAQETGEFDASTEAAVRSFQFNLHRFPIYKHIHLDGIASKDVLSALETFNAYECGMYDPKVLSNPRIRAIVHDMDYGKNVGYKYRVKSPLFMSTSSDGRAWMLYDETNGIYKKTGHVHWPKYKSGVTLGPGYDMRDRTRDEVIADLTSEKIGLQPKEAEEIAMAAGMQPEDAKDFAAKHDWQSGSPLPRICLNKEQHLQLMARYLPYYEIHYVQKYVYVNLLQREFDALVSVAANPSRSIVSLANAINQGRISDALDDILSRVPSDSTSSIGAGMRVRRRREVQFYLTGRYQI
jgi:GH24 family phage-related lysozyme (muramidase)